MSEQDFLGDPQSAQVETPPVQEPVKQATSEFSDLLTAITSPDGKPKYNSVQEALRGAAHAQKHIQTLEQENAELKNLSTQVETLKALMQENLMTQGKADQPVLPKVEDLENIVRSTLERTKQEEIARTNRQAVLNTLKEKFGDGLDKALETQAQELGLSVAELGALASKSPKAVLKAFNVETKGTPAVQGTVNTQALQPAQTELKAPDNIMWGASHKDVTAFFRQIKQEVNKELGIN